MTHVIFICTGNICRSAMAHGYLNYVLEKENIYNVFVSSAGTSTYDGSPATKYAIDAISKYGVDLTNHRSTSIENSDILNADYILVMTNRHKREVISRWPKLESKVHLLKEYVEDSPYEDIDDPWGLSIEVYNDCAKEIVETIDKFVMLELKGR